MARRAATERVVDLVGDWTAGAGPLYRSLARALTVAIERGALARGARLPSERSLASAVSVSRGVVVAAYDDLVAAGLIERVAGSGTFVGGSPGEGLPPDRDGSALIAQLVDRPPLEVIDLSISVLADADGLPEVTLTTREVGAHRGGAGASPSGLTRLREVVARRITEAGLDTGPEQVVITTGAQQGISVAVGSWVRPGDVVVVDDPTYPGVLASLAAAGAIVRPVPVDRDGIVLGALADALAERPALAYVQSAPHSPTGGLLSPHRRAQVAALVVAHHVPLIEDLALWGLRWAPQPSGRIVPIASHAPDHPIAVVGSFSKQFWAGLRVGFVRAPGPVADRLARVKATHDLGSSVMSQLAAERLLEHPGRDQAAQRRDRGLARRCELLQRLLADRLPDWRWDRPTGGLSLWVQLPTTDAARFAAAARRHGVVVATADGLSATQDHRDRIRLTFAVPTEDLRTAVDRLGAAWDELHPGS